MQSGVVRVSSNDIAQKLGFTASQVRQDFNCFGGFGQQGFGYRVESLLEEISSIIGIDKKHSAVIIGVGNLGHALVNNFDFRNCGFSLDAAFDANPGIIGARIGDVEILSIDELERFYAKNPFQVAVLAVPKAVAHTVAKRLAALGVSGIWNFTNVDLDLHGSKVKVENVHFSDSLMTLCYGITEIN